MKPKLFTSSFIIAFITSISIWLANYIIVTIIPLILSEKMQATRSEIGSILGLSSLGILFLRPIMGYIIDKLGKRLLLSCALCLLFLTNLSYVIAQSPHHILIIRILQIISFSTSSTAMTTIALDIIPENRRGEGLNYFTSASTLALALGPSLGISLFHSNFPESTFIISSLGILLCFCFSFFIKIPKKDYSTKLPPINSMFDKRILVISIIVAIGYMSTVSLTSYSTLYALELKIPQEKAALAITFFSFGIISTRIITARMIDNKGPKFSGLLSTSLFTLSLLILGTSHSITTLCLGGFLLGCGAGITLPMGLAMANALANPINRGTCTGLIYTGVDIGHSLGSALFGYLGDFYNNFGIGYLILSFINLISIIFFRFFVYPYFVKSKMSNILHVIK